MHVDQMLQQEAALEQIERSLRERRSLATIVFFDLAGSTAYRAHRTPERGLAKAFQHNVLVSQAVERLGGRVVKWIGDGIMACFAPEDEIPELHPQGEPVQPHSLRGILAAVAAIESLRLFNKRFETPGDAEATYKEIHTRVGICSGLVHYIALRGVVPPASGDAPEAICNVLDPIGTAADVAARLQGMAADDCILVEHDSFFGRWNAELSIGNSQPMCCSEEAEVHWCRLARNADAPAALRPPCYSIFFPTPQGLEASRRSMTGSEAADEDRFLRLAQEEAERRGATADCPWPPFVFGLQAEPCNVRGLKAPLQVLAFALRPVFDPIHHQPAVALNPQESDSKLGEAEKAFGVLRISRDQMPTARGKFNEVLRVDPRCARAHVFMALTYWIERSYDAALDHAQHALAANPGLAIAWKLRAMLNFMKVLAKQNGSLDDAIGGFMTASKKAGEQFDIDTERCSDAFLAMSYFLRGKQGDNVLAEELVDRLNAVRSKSPVLQVMNRLLAVMRTLRTETAPVWGNLVEEIKAAQGVLGDDNSCGDSLLAKCDLEILAAEVDHRVKIARCENG
jgi:class 3 adenylate cyclase/tetratricopeptide (TPR) repeat protein